MTDLLVTMKVAEEEFAAIDTLAGTVAAAMLSLARFTTIPPDGATVLSLTVAVELTLPPNTDDGDKDSDCT